MKGKQPAGSAINWESVGIVGSGSAGGRENGSMIVTYGKDRNLSMGMRLILEGEFPMSREFFP
jgi:hypothetical protein